MFEITATNVEQTVAFGERLGRVLEAGDFVALEGPLGAGKTRLAEGIARGLGVEPARRIPSPTFTLINEHEGRVLLVHADLYRLRGPDELYELGWSDYLEREVVMVVEWLSIAGREKDVAPADRIEVTLSAPDENTRVIRISATGPRSTARLHELAL